MTNDKSVKTTRTLVLGFLGLMTGASMAQGAEVTSLMSKDLPDISGREVLMITVEKAPGGSDPIYPFYSTLHLRNYAHVFLYVLEGSLVMPGDREREVTLTPGQTWYEGPHDVHSIGRNASNTKPVKFLLFFVRDKGRSVLVPTSGSE